MARRGHGEGTIYHRNDGRWEAQITVEGRKRRYFYGRTRQEVQRKLQDAQLAHREGRLRSEPSDKTAEYLQQWLEIVRESVRPRTWDSYSLCIRRASPFIGDVKLDQLKAAHLQVCYAELRKTLSARSVQQVHVVLHGAFESAVKLGLLYRNPTDAATSPRARRTEMQTLTAEHVQLLFDTTHGDRFANLWVLLATTGLRLGEALALKWADVDLPTRRLMVRRTLARRRNGGGLVFDDTKSGSSRRTVQLSTVACEALQAQQDRQGFDRKAAEKDGLTWTDHDLVFSSVIGTPLEQGRIHRHFKPALKRTGLPAIRIHDLRHTAATLMLTRGVHPKVVSEMLGHSNITITLTTYSHVLPTMHQAAADEMDVLFSRHQATV